MEEKSTQQGALRRGAGFLRRHAMAALLASMLMIVPCWWQRHIEAGDLGSHVYNAWLTQLIEKGQAPGLYLEWRWDNVLFDLMLLNASKAMGLLAAEKVVVSGCVLVFFWGVFALVAAASKRVPWMLAPCIALLAYGYSFQMGFLNYYLSIGLACAGLALVWDGGSADEWLVCGLLAFFSMLAHPIGFLLLVGGTAYLFLRRKLTGWWRAAPPIVVLAAAVAGRWYLHRRTDLNIDWGDTPFYLSNGADQLNVYGSRYAAVASVALGVCVACWLADAYLRRKEAGWWKSAILPLELYGLAFAVTASLPENLRVSLYAAWIGLLVSRLTTISAIFGLCVLGTIKWRRWPAAGFAALAVVYFVFLFQDQRKLNQAERNAENVLARLPYGTRIIPTIAAPDGWRVEFPGHLVDRACIGRCFVYSNYEPSSGQFRVRARKGSPIATDSSNDAEDMQGGAYEVQDTDPPLTQLYQCDAGADWTRLCLLELHEGDNTGSAGRRR